MYEFTYIKMISWHRDGELFSILLHAAKWTAHRNKVTDISGIIHRCWKTVFTAHYITQSL